MPERGKRSAGAPVGEDGRPGAASSSKTSGEFARWSSPAPSPGELSSRCPHVDAESCFLTDESESAGPIVTHEGDDCLVSSLLAERKL